MTGENPTWAVSALGLSGWSGQAVSTGVAYAANVSSGFPVLASQLMLPVLEPYL
jgi:hypothetical protein